MKALTDIADISNENARRDREWSAELQKQQTAGARDAQRDYALVNAKAADFERQTRELAPLVTTYRAETTTFFDALERLVDLQLDAGISTLEEMRVGLASYAKVDDAARGVRDVYARVAHSLAGLATPTQEFRRKRTKLAEQLELFVSAVDYWLERSSRLRRKFGLGETYDA
jgi:hypothetical protein